VVKLNDKGYSLHKVWMSSMRHDKKSTNNEGIEFETINVEDNEQALTYIKEELGLSSMPVVVVEGQEPFTGFRPDKLQELK
jgi:glutaredoxin